MSTYKLLFKVQQTLQKPKTGHLLAFDIVFTLLFSRVHGGILRLYYIKDPDFSKKSEELLQNQLKELVTLHKVITLLYLF